MRCFYITTNWTLMPQVLLYVDGVKVGETSGGEKTPHLMINRLCEGETSDSDGSVSARLGFRHQLPPLPSGRHEVRHCDFTISSKPSMCLVNSETTAVATHDVKVCNSSPVGSCLYTAARRRSEARTEPVAAHVHRVALPVRWPAGARPQRCHHPCPECPGVAIGIVWQHLPGALHLVTAACVAT
jgi:hypothetical protein